VAKAERSSSIAANVFLVAIGPSKKAERRGRVEWERVGTGDERRIVRMKTP